MLGYLLYLIGIGKVAESIEKSRAIGRRRRVDQWHESRGFNPILQQELQFELRRSSELRDKTWEEMHPGSIKGGFTDKDHYDMLVYLLGKRGYRYFESWKYWNDPTWKKAYK